MVVCNWSEVNPRGIKRREEEETEFRHISLRDNGERGKTFVSVVEATVSIYKVRHVRRTKKTYTHAHTPAKLIESIEQWTTHRRLANCVVTYTVRSEKSIRSIT